VVNKPYSLTKKQRIGTKQESKIELVNCKTKTLILIAKQNDVNYSRLKVVVPKKYVALSVNRNRIKRWVRESFRLEQRSLQGLDVVAISRYTGNTITYLDCQKAFEKLITMYQTSC
jgi:ribonuclease P protein component